MRSVKKTIKSPQIKATLDPSQTKPKTIYKDEAESKTAPTAPLASLSGETTKAAQSAASNTTGAPKNLNSRKTSARAGILQGSGETSVAVKSAEAMVKTIRPVNASSPDLRQVMDAAAPSKARTEETKVSAKKASKPKAAARVTSPSKLVALLRAAKQKLMDAATTPELSIIFNPAPGADEQTTVTKKIEKKTSEEMSAATDAAVTPTNDSTTQVILESAVKAAASGNPPTPVAKASPSLTSPLETAQSIDIEAERPREAEPPVMVDSKPGEKVGAPANKTGKTSSSTRQGFKPNEFIVYPAHGVGQIVAIEEQEVAGFKLELFVISFAKDKMILKVPTPKVVSVGMRKLAEADVVKRALDTLMGRARVKRTMWSRRAQEYEAKINSGDLISIAEVVRDLYRSDAQPEQSYSERQLYEAALDRMAREIVVVQKLTETEALKSIEAQLQKGPRRGKPEEIETEVADIEEAA
jgi:CarD family transcriptional regulator